MGYLKFPDEKVYSVNYYYLVTQNLKTMEIKKTSLIFWLVTLHLTNIHSQIIEKPSFALKSHETLEISKVEISGSKTEIYLTIENRINGGNFCADRNIYILEPGGERLKLIKSSGIPVCPETYKFKAIGEKLDFVLTFPPLKSGTEWVDLIEDCQDNCFSFYGLTLDNDLNRKIDEAISFVDRGETFKAIGLYKSIIQGLGTAEKGVMGSLYSDLIALMVKIGDSAGAREWYNKMLSSDVPRLQLYLSNLSSRGIKF